METDQDDQDEDDEDVYDLEVMGSNPSWVELGVLSTSV